MKHLTRCMFLLFCTFIFLLITTEINEASGDRVPDGKQQSYDKLITRFSETRQTLRVIVGLKGTVKLTTALSPLPELSGQDIFHYSNP